MSVAQRVYLEAMYLDNFTCVYCGHRSPDMTVDHFIPESLGGPDVIQNIVACCSACNSRKSARAPYECFMTPVYGRYSYVVQAPDVMAEQRTEIAIVQRQGINSREQAIILRAAEMKRQNYKWAEIAEITGMSISTIRRRVGEINKQLTNDTPSMSSLRRLVANSEQDRP